MSTAVDLGTGVSENSIDQIIPLDARNSEYIAETLASQEYLKPETNLGEAVLRLSVHKTTRSDGRIVNKFVIEIYDEVMQDMEQLDGDGNPIIVKMKVARSPRSIRAQRFVEKRFLHGATKLNRANVYHPIYEVPMTDYTVHLIQRAWTNRTVISDAAKPFFQEIYLREFVAEQNAERTANYKINGIVPSSEWFDEQDRILKERTGKELTAYQKCASFNSCHSKAFALFCAPGTGKTLMMIRKLDHTIHNAELSGRVSFTLISCPKTIRTNWKTEIAQFSNCADKIHIITLRGLNNTERLVNCLTDIASVAHLEKHIVLISGYESFVATKQLLAAPLSMEFDLCLLDEGHNISNPSTKRTKYYLEARRNGHFASVVLATGTPFRNTPFDIYCQLEFLGNGYSGFESYSAFKAFYGEYQASHEGMAKLTGFQNIPLLKEKMARYAFIIGKEEALPFLPKKTWGTLETSMSKEQKRVYVQLASQLGAEIEAKIAADKARGAPETMTVNNVLSMMLRLAEITSGYARLDNKEAHYFTDGAKLELLIRYLIGDKPDSELEDSEDSENGSAMEGILQDKNRKALVWVCFKENIEMIRERLAKHGIKSVGFHGTMKDADKQNSIDQFNCDPETQVFVGIAASGGVGLNLVGFDPHNPTQYTTNTTDCIYYSSNWSAGNRSQADDRAHRLITRVPLHITDLLIPGTIDMDIYYRVQGKIEMSERLQDIKEILQAILNLIPQIENGN